MTISWAGPEPDALPPLTARDVARLVRRAVAIAAVTACCFAAFLACRGIDIALRALTGRPLPALAPGPVRLWGLLALRLVGIGYRQVGEPMQMPGAMMANHSSWLDIVVLMRASRVYFVSKAEVGHWPVIGTMARALGTVFIERRPAEAKRQRDLLFARLVVGDRMVLFPEGTSTDGRRVLRFKSSLFDVFFASELRERIWVQPVTIVYHAPPGLPPSFFGWWGGMDFLASLREVLARSRGGSVEAVFHAPLRVADFAGRKQLAEATEAAVRAALHARLRGTSAIAAS